MKKLIPLVAVKVYPAEMFSYIETGLSIDFPLIRVAVQLFEYSILKYIWSLRSANDGIAIL
jgi:hypothetical protein